MFYCLKLEPLYVSIHWKPPYSSSCNTGADCYRKIPSSCLNGPFTAFIYLFSTWRQQGLYVPKTLRKRGPLACFISLAPAITPFLSLAMWLLPLFVGIIRGELVLCEVLGTNTLCPCFLYICRSDSLYILQGSRGQHCPAIHTGSVLLDLRWSLFWCHTTEV